MADRDNCPNAQCEHGWCRVLEGYAERMAPEPEMPEDDTPAADLLRAQIALKWQADLAAARDTWYPCRECNTTAFFRWHEGHFDPDHTVGACSECSVARHGRSATSARRRAPALAVPPDPTTDPHHSRKDLDL